MNVEKLVRGELIGLNVNVIGKNITGKIVDETKNSILIETKKGRKMVMKINNDFEFVFSDKKISVNGKQLASRPEDRVKRKVNL